MKTKTDHSEHHHDPWHEFLTCLECEAIIETKVAKLNGKENTLREVWVRDKPKCDHF